MHEQELRELKEELEKCRKRIEAHENAESELISGLTASMRTLMAQILECNKKVREFPEPLSRPYWDIVALCTDHMDSVIQAVKKASDILEEDSND